MYWLPHGVILRRGSIPCQPLRYNYGEANPPKTPNQLSDVTIWFIALATLLLAPRKIQPNVIVIDEPELGLHPLAIRILANMLKQAAENVQILVATQSPLFLDFFDANDVLVFEAPDESTKVKRLNRDELSSWAQEYTLSELWDKNVIGGQP